MSIFAQKQKAFEILKESWKLPIHKMILTERLGDAKCLPLTVDYMDVGITVRAGPLSVGNRLSDFEEKMMSANKYIEQCFTEIAWINPETHGWTIFGKLDATINDGAAYGIVFVRVPSAYETMWINLDMSPMHMAFLVRIPNHLPLATIGDIIKHIYFRTLDARVADFLSDDIATGFACRYATKRIQRALHDWLWKPPYGINCRLIMAKMPVLDVNEDKDKMTN